MISDKLKLVLHGFDKVVMPAVEAGCDRKTVAAVRVVRINLGEIVADQVVWEQAAGPAGNADLRAAAATIQMLAGSLVTMAAALSQVSDGVLVLTADWCENTASSLLATARVAMACAEAIDPPAPVAPAIALATVNGEIVA